MDFDEPEIAALYVETDGCYFGLSHVDPWDEKRDARRYDGPFPVVAHPPCKRWGRFWHGSPLKPHVFAKGDDGGCFAAALEAVRRFGGVLEHPAYSHAWEAYGLPWPPAEGWQRDIQGGWCCQVEQGFYGHESRKPTWLYAVGAEPPPLQWGRGEQRLSPVMIERHGYEKARRCGVMALAGKMKRARTPVAFRDILLSIAGAAK